MLTYKGFVIVRRSNYPLTDIITFNNISMTSKMTKTVYIERSSVPLNTSLSDRSIGFMLGVIHRRAVSVMTHRLKAYDITTEQWSVLLQIYMNEGLNQREIAVKAYKDQPTTTRILDMLEKKHLIIRKPSQKDRRAFELFLTELGRDLSGTLVPLENKFNEEIAQIIPEEDMDVFWKVLSEMGSYLDTLLEKESQTK